VPAWHCPGGAGSCAPARCIEAARTVIAAIVDAYDGHPQDDATVMCPDWHGVGHSRRDADTGADLTEASAASRAGPTAPGR
jgi:hypothetical protein